MNITNDRIEIRVYGPNHKEMSVFLPWDANISDWTTAFRVILTHQEFSTQLINDLLPDETD